MNLSLPYKKIIVEIVCCLYILLFVYAAVSKWADITTFRGQLGQSPLLTSFADELAILIPALEICTSLLLCFKRARFVGLSMCLFLMIAFTVYIVIILNFSSFIPCSCGGILSNLGWNEHLVFNVFFIVLAITGLLLVRDNYFQNISWPQFTLIELGGAIMSIIIVITLYYISDNEIHNNNGFIRRFPHHPAAFKKSLPLQYNSYYIAGFSGDKIILGNVTAPMHLIEIDTSFRKIATRRITLDCKDFGFSRIEIFADEKHFILYDGSVPAVYTGSTQDWNARLAWQGDDLFTTATMMDSLHLAVRSNTKGTGENIIGVLSLSPGNAIKYNGNILEKRLDGIFDTDGRLHFNKRSGKIIYTYYYRNRFITASKDLQTFEDRKTIDTISQIPMEFVYLHGSEKKIAKPPKRVNEFSTTAGRYLFIRSENPGRYEQKEALKDASIIDVYDIDGHTYKFSFYLYDHKGEKIKKFSIRGNLLIGLTEKDIVHYYLRPKDFGIITDN